MSKELLTQADYKALWEQMCERCNELDKRLAQPEQEPVQWGVDWGKAGETPCVSIIKRKPNGGIEVVAVEYGPPLQRTWVGLTDEEIKALVSWWPSYDQMPALMVLAKDIQNSLKDKNEGR